MSQGLIERAEQAILAAQEAPFPRANELLKGIIRELLDRGDLEDHSICCAIARCWYHHPRGIAEPDTAERWLRRALALEPGNHLARLYLGRIRLDEGRWREAREQLDLIPDGLFAASGQAWLDFKKEEWTLCCDLMPGQGRLDVEALRGFCERLAALPHEQAPVPGELVRVLTRLAEDPARCESAREAVRECAALIRRLGLAEAFRPELARLRGKVLLAPPPARPIVLEPADFFDYEWQARRHVLEQVA